MGFWIFMLIMDLLIPVTMIVLGRRFTDKPPGEINSIYGYRTGRSMKNRDTWDFAHRYFGRLWFFWGGILLPITIAVMLFLIGKDTDTVGTIGGIISFVQIIPLIGVILPTERALRDTFDEQGKRR